MWEGRDTYSTGRMGDRREGGVAGWGVGGGEKQEGEDIIGMTGGRQHLDKREREEGKE